MVPITEWMTKNFAYVLWDLYDTYRIWYVPTLVRNNIRSVDFSFLFGSMVNNFVIIDHIDVIDDIYWSEVTLCQARRGTLRNDESLSPTQNVGDFAWYDPYSSFIIGSVYDCEIFHTVRSYAEKFPTGFVFV